VRRVSCGPSSCRPPRSRATPRSEGSGAGPPGPHPNRVEALALGEQLEGGVVGPHPARVVGAGGNGRAPKKGVGCACGWMAAQAAPSTVRALQLREHVFCQTHWGRAGAREVRRVLQRHLPQKLELLPKHVGLLEPPGVELHPLVWAAVCLALLLVSKRLRQCSDLSHATGVQAPDSRAGGGAPAMESRLSTLTTCGFGVRTSLEAHNQLSCPRSAYTALKP